MNEAELQAQVMAFVDRFTSQVTAAVGIYKDKEPSPENYKHVLSLGAYSMSSAFTIAAESNPSDALLYMITMITLGRMIFEENMYDKIGPQIQPMIEGYRKAENEIWQIHGLISTVDQMGLEKTIPHLLMAVETIEAKGEKWVSYSFFLGVALIIIFLVCAVGASLIYRHLALKIFGSRLQQINS